MIKTMLMFEHLQTKEIVDLYNQFTDNNKVKRFACRATAIERTYSLLQRLGKLDVVNNNFKQSEVKMEDDNKFPGPRTKFYGKKIKLLKTENPRRKKNGHGYYTWENIYQEGMTFEEFKAKGGRTEDLKWDLRKGNLEMID